MKTLHTESTAHVVTDPDEIRELRRFQAQRYVEAGLVATADQILGPDPLERFSTWFTVRGPRGQIWATSRFIDAENRSLPLFNDFSIDPWYADMLASCEDQVSEVSRLAIAPEAPSVTTFTQLVREMVHHSVRVGRHTVLVAAVEPALVTTIRRVLKMACPVIGPQRHDYYNTTNVPVMMDGVQWLANLRFDRPHQWRYFANDMVLHPALLRDRLRVAEPLVL